MTHESDLGSGDDVVLADARRAVGDVVGNGASEERRLLPDPADLRPAKHTSQSQSSTKNNSVMATGIKRLTWARYSCTLNERMSTPSTKMPGEHSGTGQQGATSQVG